MIDKPDTFPPPPAGEGQGGGYYDYPVVRRPVWTWEIPPYFWLGGMSAGAFLTASLAERLGSTEDRRYTADGFYVAAAAIVPCAPMLIADLGRPERFHHMLRIFKPLSPMNLGAWALTAFSALSVARAIARAGETGLLRGPLQALTRLLPKPLIELIMASAMSSGSAAVTLSAARRGAPDATLHRLATLESAASLGEMAMLTGYLVQSGKTARSLTTGRVAAPFWLGAVGAGTLLPLLLHRLAGRRRGSTMRSLSTAAAVCTIAGSLALRWSIFEAGKDSSEDQSASFELSGA